MSDVIHLPYGQEHPYEQGPEERFPRDPLAGERFTIGIITRPPAAVQRVLVHSCVNDEPKPPIEATSLRNWQPTLEEGVGAEFLERMIKVDQDVWQVQLTAPDVGDTLSYWIEADGVTGPRYSVKGKGWRKGKLSRLAASTIKTGVFSTQIDPRTEDGLPGASPSPALRQVEWLTDGERAYRVRLSFGCKPDEAFYGLGERFNTLNQRGEVLDVRVYEQYKTQGKRTYMPIPFLLSSGGYGLYVRSNRWMQFDLAATTLRSLDFGGGSRPR